MIRKLNTLFLPILFFLLLSSCDNDGANNKEMSTEITTTTDGKKVQGDLIPGTKEVQKEVTGFHPGLSDEVAEIGEFAISCTQLFLHFLP